MKSPSPRILKENFALIEPRGKEISAYFYGRLFAENPSLRAYFPPAMDLQRHRLFHALRKVVWSLDSPDTLAAFLSQLGRDHRKYGVAREHYDAVGSALLATLRKFSGDAWTAEVESAWRAVYATMSTMMIQAAEEDAAKTPPWWTGEVVEHELRGPDLATLTVRPDRRLPYRAGQYVAIQTAHWPRIWRPYSVANAPRADGLLRFHVRAIPGGWIGDALVRHVKLGDTLLLGHASGTMTLELDANRAILCVAGGTGLAPIKALVEEAIERDLRRDIHLLFGARTPAGLYDLADLRALEARSPWLRVIPVVSEDRSFEGVQGALPDVLDRFQDWSGHDVYVAGPPEMVERTIMRLNVLGVPAAHIHHDQVDT